METEVVVLHIHFADINGESYEKTKVARLEADAESGREGGFLENQSLLRSETFTFVRVGFHFYFAAWKSFLVFKMEAVTYSACDVGKPKHLRR